MSIGIKANSIFLIITIRVFILLLLILMLRSFIYTKRILSDIVKFSNSNSKVEDFLPYIKPCLTEIQGLTDEEKHILNYRSLGTICKK